MTEADSTLDDSDARKTASRRPLLPLVLLVSTFFGYVAVVIAQHRGALDSVQWSSDAVWPQLFGRAVASGHAGALHTFSYSNIVSVVPDIGLWKVGGDGATEIFEPLLLLIAFALLVWRAWQLGGAVAAATTGILACALSPLMIVYMAPQSFHGPTVVGAVIVAASIPALTDRTHQRGLLMTGLAVLIGCEIVSDPLTVAIVVAPLMILPVILGLITGFTGVSSLVKRLVVVGFLIVVVVLIATGLERFLNFAILPTEGGDGLASWQDVPQHLSLLVRGASQLVAGIANATRRSWQLADYVGAMIAIALAVTALYAVVLLLANFRRRRNITESSDVERVAYVLFWGLSLAACAVAFVSTSYAVDTSSARYITVVIPGLAALVGIAPIVDAGKIVLVMGAAVMNTMLLLTTPAEAFHAPQTAGDLPRVLTALEDRGLHHGYAAYWDALPLTVNSGGAVAARPVMTGFACAAFPAPGACRYTLLTADGWYDPVPGPSFLLVHDDGACLHSLPPIDQTTQTITVGSDTIYVFADDLGSHFSAPRYAFCPAQLDHP